MSATRGLSDCTIVGLAVLLLLGSPAIASGPNHKRCLTNFKPTVLTGVLHRVSYPIEGLEKPYVYWLLRLAHPICTVPDPADQSGEAENNGATGVRDVQLVLDPDQYHEYRRFLGKPVRVSGAPFHMANGRHMTLVLLGLHGVVIHAAGPSP